MQNQVIQVEFEFIRKAIHDLDAKVTDVVHLLIGGNLEKDKGMVADVKASQAEIEKLEQRVAHLEIWLVRLKWTGVVMTFPAIWGIIDMIRQGLNK